MTRGRCYFVLAAWAAFGAAAIGAPRSAGDRPAAPPSSASAIAQPTASVSATQPAARTPEELLSQILHYKFGDSREPLIAAEGIVFDSSLSPQQRVQIAAALGKTLEMEATPEARQFVCRLLSVVGTDNEVPPLAAMLPDDASVDAALYALERIPGATAERVLIDAAGKASAKSCIGAVNSLGARRAAAAVPALVRLMSEQNVELASAAIAALGKIGGEDAIGPLKEAMLAQEPTRKAAAQALLVCAQGLLAEKKDSEAAGIFQAILSKSKDPDSRAQATLGLAQSDKPRALALALVALKTENEPALQAAGLLLVRQIPGEEASKAFAKEWSGLPRNVKAPMLASLAYRGDAKALPAALEAAKSEDPEIRQAGLAALSWLGGAAEVALLGQAAASESGPCQASARESLATMRGKDVDGAIVQRLSKAAPAEQAELIRSLAARVAPNAAPALLQYARGTDPAVRQAALKALASLSHEGDLPDLIALLTSFDSEEDRKLAEAAVVASARRIPKEEDRAEPMLKALASAKTPEGKTALLPALGLIGGAKALDAVCAAQGEPDPAVQDAAIRALAEWAAPIAMPRLWAVAKGKGSETHRVLALQGYIRLLNGLLDRPPKERTPLYKETLELAWRADEKRQALSGVALVRDAAAMDLALSFTKDAEVAAEAWRAAISVAAGLRGQQPGQADEVLQKALRDAKDPDVRDMAAQIRDGKLDYQRIARMQTYRTLSFDPFAMGRRDGVTNAKYQAKLAPAPAERKTTR